MKRLIEKKLSCEGKAKPWEGKVRKLIIVVEPMGSCFKPKDP